MPAEASEFPSEIDYLRDAFQTSHTPPLSKYPSLHRLSLIWNVRFFVFLQFVCDMAIFIYFRQLSIVDWIDEGWQPSYIFLNIFG